jgi:hypothetical protein
MSRNGFKTAVFVGGPLDGQWRTIDRQMTTIFAPKMVRYVESLAFTDTSVFKLESSSDSEILFLLVNYYGGKSERSSAA